MDTKGAIQGARPPASTADPSPVNAGGEAKKDSTLKVSKAPDQFLNVGEGREESPSVAPSPAAVRLQAVAPHISRSDPTFQKLLGVANKFYRDFNSYPEMFKKGYTLAFGPLADVLPSDPTARAESLMGKLGRIHSSRTEAVTLFGKLTIAKTEASGQRGVFIIKHAIGYGSLGGKSLESSNEPPRDTRSLEKIKKDFSPFRKILNGFPSRVGVMVAGAKVIAIDPDTPAVLSPLVTRVIREELGAMGEDAVLMTDDMNAGIFWGHIKQECSKEQNICEVRSDGGINRLERLSFLIAKLVEGDVDIMMIYSTPPSAILADYLKAGHRLLERGIITREQLEKSVTRILRMKQGLYPEHPRLMDISQTVSEMSVDELLGQKLLLAGAWPVSTLPTKLWSEHWLAELKSTIRDQVPIFGFSLEGTKTFVRKAKVMVEAFSAQGKTPCVLSENPPLEVGGYDNAGNREHKQYKKETEPVREFTELLDKFYPSACKGQTLFGFKRV